MNILILTQYFYPENNARSFRLGFFSKFLADHNFNVNIICQTPNYPSGIIFKGYKNKLLHKERIDKVDVIRSWVWITQKKDFLSRVLNYISFFLSSILASFWAGKVDLIFASAPPVFVLFSGYIISKIKRVPLVIDIGDFWPDSAVEVGLMKKNFIFKLTEKLEKCVYRKSVLIIVNTKGFVERLIKYKGVEKNKIEILPNGADLNFFKSGANSLKSDKEYKLENKFVVLYTGLLGLAQAPEIMVEAAKVLESRKDIMFLIVGGGVLREKCENLAKKYNLKNIIFAGERTRSEMPIFAARANVSIIPYKNSDFFKNNIPSKIFDYMAASLPIIINLDGEGAAIIKDAMCGLIAEPENPQSLAEKILYIYNNKEIAEKMGKNGRRYAEDNYDKIKITENLLKLINNIILGKKVINYKL